MNDLRAAGALNGICPYFTMFPLDFPYAVLNGRAAAGDWVLDPFCGRGTTNFASRMLGLSSIGIDSSPVASALSSAKLTKTSPGAILRVVQTILDQIPVPSEIPAGEFWQWAFHPDVLQKICRIREGLNRDCRSDARRALRAIMMGALHGPQNKTKRSYFSNQAPRTYAPKPGYAVKFWKEHGMVPSPVDVFGIIADRAERYYSQPLPAVDSQIIQGDSRDMATFERIGDCSSIRWVITSPPYYGMRTYLPDQWLRLWFVGGSVDIAYSNNRQLSHSSPDHYASDLRKVWRQAGARAASNAKLVVRFGGINDRKAKPLALLKQSLHDSGWRIQTIKAAGSAAKGKRQAQHFLHAAEQALEEYDVWSIWEG